MNNPFIERWIGDQGIAIIFKNIPEGFTAVILFAVIGGGEIQDWKLSKSITYKYRQTARRFIIRKLECGVL